MQPELAPSFTIVNSSADEVHEKTDNTAVRKEPVMCSAYGRNPCYYWISSSSFIKPDLPTKSFLHMLYIQQNRAQYTIPGQFYLPFPFHPSTPGKLTLSACCCHSFIHSYLANLLSGRLRTCGWLAQPTTLSLSCGKSTKGKREKGVSKTQLLRKVKPSYHIISIPILYIHSLIFPSSVYRISLMPSHPFPSQLRVTTILPFPSTRARCYYWRH